MYPKLDIFSTGVQELLKINQRVITRVPSLPYTHTEKERLEFILTQNQLLGIITQTTDIWQSRFQSLLDLHDKVFEVVVPAVRSFLGFTSC